MARELLGALLCRHESDGAITLGRIVETEAYLGAQDPASHASNRRTERNAVMFDAPGHAYVYFIYGNHYCVNAVAFDKPPGAILIRAVEPLEGVERMQSRRLFPTRTVGPGKAGMQAALRNLTNGPGKLAQAFAITRALNDAPLYDAASPLTIAAGQPVSEGRVSVGPRIGIRQAAELPLRFCDRTSPYVSRR